MISDYLKAKLASEIPGILTATSHLENGKQVIRINGASVIVGPFASDNEIEAGIRSALQKPDEAALLVDRLADTSVLALRPATPLPAVNLMEPKPMANLSGSGYKAGSLKALLQGIKDRNAAVMDGAITQAQKVHAALDQVEKVSQDMASTHEGIMAELGQFSNLPPDGDEHG